MTAPNTPHRMQGVVPQAVEVLGTVARDLAPGTWNFIQENLCDMDPGHQRGLARAYVATIKRCRNERLEGVYKGSLEAEANTRLREYRAHYQIHDLCLTGSDRDLKDFSLERAAECRSIIYREEDEGRLLRRVAAVLERYGLEWPTPFSKVDERRDLTPLLNRFKCNRWWMRQIRRLQALEVERVKRLRGDVGAGRQLYCSDWNVKRLARAIVRNAQTLAGVEAINDDGEVFTLDELQQLGVANPEIRRSELMVRMRGFEEVAAKYGHKGEFWTFTTPSRFHRMTKVKNSKTPKVFKNPNWDGSCPDAGQDWLSNKWASIRSKFDREGIRCYGFRVAEPHHDGTPHWHLLLFFHPDEAAQARKIARHYLWKTDSPGEPGAWRHRFNSKAIDPEKGTAAGYLAKYVSKNINGTGLGDLESDEDGTTTLAESANRVRSWASAWGIRQFQQIGGPSVTVWRELRRLGPEDDQVDEEEGGALWEAVTAADQGDWCSFVIAMGGPSIPRSARPLKPAYWIQSRPIGSEGVGGVPIGTETYRYEPAQEPVQTGSVPRVNAGLESVHVPEVPAFIPGRAYTEYGDLSKGKVFGLWVFGKPVLTRLQTWIIQLAKTSCTDWGLNQRRECAALDLC